MYIFSKLANDKIEWISNKAFKIPQLSLVAECSLLNQQNVGQLTPSGVVKYCHPQVCWGLQPNEKSLRCSSCFTVQRKSQCPIVLADASVASFLAAASYILIELFCSIVAYLATSMILVFNKNPCSSNLHVSISCLGLCICFFLPQSASWSIYHYPWSNFTFTRALIV